MPLSTDSIAPTGQAGAPSAAVVSPQPVATQAQQRTTPKSAQAKPKTESGHADSVFIWPGDKTLETAIANIGGANRLTEVSPLRKVETSELKGTAAQSSTHMAVAVPLEGRPRQEPPLHGLTGVALGLVGVSLLAMGFMRFTIPSFISDTFGFLYDSLGWKKMEKESAFQNLFQTLLMEILYYLSVSMLAIEYFIESTGATLAMHQTALIVAAGALGVAIAYLLRYFFDFTIGYAFHIEGKMQTLVLYKRTTCGIIGLLLLPISFVIPFLTTHNYGAIGLGVVLIVISLTLWRIVRSLKIIVNDLQSFLYFILYLCTVEVTPLVCAYRMAILTGITN